jgi:serine protease Do
MKKCAFVLLMFLTISLSGVAGFTGTYFANYINNQGILASTPKASEVDNMFLSSTSRGTSTSTSSTSGKVLTINQVVNLTAASVVEISTETVITGSRMRQFISEGAGSGVIVSKDGYIITNNHVIDGASKITVTTVDKKSYQATLIGKDTKTDLAVLKIKATNLQTAVYGNSSKLFVGEMAIVIGNPLGQLGGTVTEGIISALNRDISIDGKTMNLLQTSAAVNPGNSGGALLSEYGELVGIINAKPSGSDIEGIGFAIPINTVKTIANDIIKYGYVPGRIDTGITLIDILDTQTAIMYRVQNKGLYVQQVKDKSSEFEIGDRIISVDGTNINNSSEFEKIIDKHKVGNILKVIVNRENVNLEISMNLKQVSK